MVDKPPGFFQGTEMPTCRMVGGTLARSCGSACGRSVCALAWM